MAVDWSEHYIKKGDPSAPTYYIIRRADTVVGLFSNYIVFAGHIRHALSNGYLPVIDMQNYPNSYLLPELIGKENSWEYYFEQPLRIGLKQAYDGENVIISSGEPVDFPGRDSMFQFYNNKNDTLTEWRMLVKLGLMKIKPYIQQEIDDIYDKLFTQGDRVLGIHLRGTDYTIKHHDHPIPPPLEFALSHVVSKVKKWNCNKIFLATEDKTFIPPFNQIFGDACVILDRDRVDFKDGIISVYHTDRENDFFLRGKEYLIDMALLAKCNSFISTMTSGTTGVMMMSEKFEHQYIFNLGKYGIVDLSSFVDDD